jgi:hypothetical protein
MPNLNDSVLDWLGGLLDTERTFPTCGGDLLVGGFTNGQVAYNRPFGAGHYRGHLQGFTCGASSHPGGNVTVSGYNCAQVLLEDLGLPASNTGPAIESLDTRFLLVCVMTLTVAQGADYHLRRRHGGATIPWR